MAATRKVKATAKAHAAPKNAATILAEARKGKKAKVETQRDAPAPHASSRRGKAPTPKLAKEILRAAKPGKVEAHRDEPEPQIRHAAEILKQLRSERVEFRHAESSKQAFDPNAFAEFFAHEIETEVARPATIHNDRVAKWRCQCCDALIPVHRRTTVVHGDYVLEHDDVLGLLVNGERWVPTAQTPLEVVQPGRLRNPWTGRTIEGKDAGTTGAY